MNKRTRLRAYRQGARDFAAQAVPVFLAQIAEMRAIVLHDNLRSKWRAAQTEAEQLRAELVAVTAERDRLQTGERERFDAATQMMRASNERLQSRVEIAEARVKDLEAFPVSGWQKQARESAREAADANGKLIAVTAERDAAQQEVRDMAVQLLTSEAERDSLQAAMAHARAAGYGDYCDSDDVAVALRAEDEADRELGRLVRAMPDGAELLKGGGWQVTITGDTRDDDVIADGYTPEDALRAAGVTASEEAGKP